MDAKNQYFQDNYLTPQQVANHFGLTRQAVNRWIKVGLLDAVFLGNVHLVHASALKNFTPPTIGRPRKTLAK